MIKSLLPLLALAFAACSGAGEPNTAEIAGSAKAKADAVTSGADAAPPQDAAPPAEAAPTALPTDAHPALTLPALANETAPDRYRVRFDTTKGPFVVEVHRAWAPNGADRFYNLVKIGFYDDTAFFRAIDGFMAQFGLSGYPQVNTAWRDARIEDDPVTQANTRGMVTFATAGPNTRTTQIFVNYVDTNVKLDAMGFAPFGRVVEGMDVVDTLYKGYGEGAPRGRGPSQQLIHDRGNSYLRERFPKLDWITRAEIAQ